MMVGLLLMRFFLGSRERFAMVQTYGHATPPDAMVDGLRRLPYRTGILCGDSSLL
jgi:hypothetical protein